MVAMHNFQPAYLHAMSRRIFMAAGAPRHIADVAAQVLVNANLVGHDSHGVLRIPAYLRQISEGSLAPDAEPEVLEEKPNRLLLDGRKSFGHYIAWKGLEMAIDKARQNDVCCVNFINVNHIGRLGEYAEIAARAGCIGLIYYGIGLQRRGSVVPFGGAQGRLSTNPMAAGIPTGDASPFVLDFATSVVAEGKLQVARSKGANVPEGFIVDKHGAPTTKTADFYDGGFLLPMGAHKGYGLSLLICLLGGLAGQANADNAPFGGVFMQVINIEAFTPLADYQRQVRAFLDAMKATPPAPGFKEVLVPGDFEYRLRQERLKDGIDLPETIYNQLQEQADRLGASLNKEIVEPEDIARYQN